MTAPRLTLQSGGTHYAADLRVVALKRLASGGRWRTEAMRSYSGPVLLWFTRGQGRITVAGVTRGYGAHNAVFLPPGTMHGFDMAGPVYGSAVFLPHGDLRFDAIDWPEDPVHLRLRDARRQAELTALIDTLDRELTATDLASRRALHHHTGLLSVFLERCATDPALREDRRRESAADRLAAAFASLVERDFDSAKPISAYAAELGVTPTHLTRACKQSCGRGALDIVGDRRLFEARRRLVETATPVQEIASDLGFTSAAYFARAFRASTGMTPTQFRRKG